MMDIGLLWYDDDAKRTLEQKVARAVNYYRTKYGVQPNFCWVHPTMLPPQYARVMADGVRLVGSRTVIKNHMWLGVETR